MRVITLIGLILLAATASAWMLIPEAFPTLRQRPAASAGAGSPAPAQNAAPVAAAPGAVAPAAATQASTAVTQPAAPAARPPRFDVARIGARGALVTAGRAEPGAEVTLTEGGRELGRARADARGEWVILPTEPLAPGVRELALSSRLAGQDPVPGAETVVLLVPERPGSADQMAGGAPAAAPAAAPVAPQAAAAAAAAATVAAAGSASAMPRPAPAVVAGAAQAAAPAQAQGQAAPQAQAQAQAQAAPMGAMAMLLPSAAAADAAPRLLQAPVGGADQARLAVDVVDYDDAGAMRFAGSATPGSLVRLYVDADLLGDARTDASGRWNLTPPNQPGLGRHTLRADQLAANGQVVARVEVPFQRDTVPPELLRDGRVVVQPGHSLWRISRNTYGRGVRYTVIYAANRDQIRDPALIYPGQVFTLPTTGR